MSLRWGSSLYLLLLSAAACGSDARLGSNFASGFVPSHHTVSVLGVFKDGRMSSEAWDSLAAKISPSLGARSCEPGYGAALLAMGTALPDAIDEYAQSNGPTDELLGQLAPAAKGELIAVITFAGRLPVPQSVDLVGAKQAAPVNVGASRGPTGGQGGAAGAGDRWGPKSRPADPNLLDISASFYSVSQARSVGVVSMEYSGQSVDEAIARFAAKLAQEMPSTSCVGWNWGAKLDPDQIRKIIDH